MQDWQRRLDSRYRTLRDSRLGPVFFIEHGLDEREREALIDEVAHELTRTVLLNNSVWDAHPLPLLVAAVETGYHYRGTGADFWPVLESRLGKPMTTSSREHIRKLFELATKTYRGARPPDTPWTGHFTIISWPITHALVPLELHQPLAATLANLRVRIDDTLNDGSVHDEVRAAARSSSSRFQTLLEDRALIVAITRHLLADGSRELSEEAAERLFHDLNQDHIARLSVDTARQRQRLLHGPTRATSSPATSTHVRRGRERSVGSLVLGYFERLEDEPPLFVLGAVFEPPPAALREAICRAVSFRQPEGVSLWGESAPVPIERLLAGLPFALRLESSFDPTCSGSLLPELDTLELPANLHNTLETFELELGDVLLFTASEEPEETLNERQVRPGKTLELERSYWLLCTDRQIDEVEDIEELEEVGECGPYRCFRAQPAEEVERDVLAQLGFLPRQKHLFSVIGPPAAERAASIPAFAVGDQLYLKREDARSEPQTIRSGGRDVVLAGSAGLLVTVEAGAHTIEIIRDGHTLQSYEFSGRSQLASRPPACTIVQLGGEPTIQSLLRAELVFGLESLIPLEDVELTVQLRLGAHKLYQVSTRIEQLPAQLTCEQEPLRTLLGEDVREQLAYVDGALLVLKVGRLCCLELSLERRVQSCWWEFDAAGTPSLVGELGALAHGVVRASSPASAPQPITEAPDEVYLLAPLALDGNVHGDTARFNTCCEIPPRVSLAFLTPHIPTPRLSRSLRSRGTRLGLEALVEGYLRWALADTRNTLAEMKRRQVLSVMERWLVEVCCGQHWLRREELVEHCTPHEALVQAIERAGIGVDPDDPYAALSPEIQFRARHIAARRILEQNPRIWSGLKQGRQVDSDALDSFLLAAYEELASWCFERLDFEQYERLKEADCYTSEEVWREALLDARATLEMHGLAVMIWPSSGAEHFISFEPATMTLSELAEAMHTWLTPRADALAGRLPTVEVLHAMLALWSEPDACLRLGWRELTEVLLVERALVRLTRYITLRRRVAALAHQRGNHDGEGASR